MREIYTCLDDKILIEKSFDNMSRLVFGKNRLNKIKSFKSLFDSRVKEVKILPQGQKSKYIDALSPGICRLDPDDLKIAIEMYGYNRSRSNQHSFIKHEGTHEFCHAFANLLPGFISKNAKPVVNNGFLCQNNMGMIKKMDPNTGQLVPPGHYGKMFNETMMDIASVIAINAFDTPNGGKKVDEILQTPYTEWGNSTTGYSIFTSITRLTIAAFSNFGFINYQNLIDSNRGIFDVDVKMKNGEIYKANDFLYGIFFDPLHIQKEFDKFMGEGSYAIFAESLDKLFNKCLTNQQIPSKEVKIIMNILPNFLNKRMNYYKEQGIISQANEYKIIGNFNQIWNSMQMEYSAFFSQSEINEIGRKAGRL